MTCGIQSAYNRVANAGKLLYCGSALTPEKIFCDLVFALDKRSLHKLKPIYDRYQASKGKEKFLRGYEREIILFAAAARECKRLGAVPLPSAERMQAEMDALTARRAALTAERQKARREEQDYAAVRRNAEEFLSPPRQAPARQKDMELE